MTLILKLDLDMIKMYLHTNEVSMSRGSKVMNRQTDRQTDRHDRKHYLPTYAGSKNVEDILASHFVTDKKIRNFLKGQGHMEEAQTVNYPCRNIGFLLSIFEL